MLIESGTIADIKRFAKQHELAFIIGNGVNMHIQGTYCVPKASRVPSWDQLLRKCSQDSPEWNRMDLKCINSYPELFSIAMLNSEENIHRLAKDVFRKCTPSRYHKVVTDKLIQYDCPVLTTNYDKLLDGGLDCFSANASGIYETIFMEYRSIRELDSPETGFAIWHINGVCDSEKTIRLGIGNYANYLTKINEFIPKAPEYKVSNIAQNSWLKPFLINKLCIVGLGLREEEFVLRWLLYKRRVCWKQLHNSNSKKNTGWYLYSQKDSLSESSKIFLKSMGIIPICFRDRKTIYKSLFDV